MGAGRIRNALLILVLYSTFSRLTSPPIQNRNKGNSAKTRVPEYRMRTWNGSARGNALFEVLYFVFLSSDKNLSRIRSSLLYSSVILSYMRLTAQSEVVLITPKL
jgi:hypothetical protein